MAILTVCYQQSSAKNLSLVHHSQQICQVYLVDSTQAEYFKITVKLMVEGNKNCVLENN
jgi:hypothetical protein